MRKHSNIVSKRKLIRIWWPINLETFINMNTANRFYSFDPERFPIYMFM